MNIEVITHANWNKVLRLANESVELLVTLDVGPRVLSFRTHGGSNILKNYDDQLGGTGESEWKIRGGHRLWIAPEDEVLTYHLDNDSVEFRADPATGEILIDSTQTHAGRITKTLGLLLDPKDSHVTLRHTARNDGDEPIQIATWGLTVMNPGGLEIIPQPPLGEHPRDLLPNRGIVLWPYTDLTDPRWYLGQKFFTLRQGDGLPTKLGLAHRERWVAYVWEDSLFLKAIEHIEGAVYPDGGCNFETFTNSEMIEIESLSPLATLSPGESVSHTEHWHLFSVDNETQIESEQSLANWLTPFLYKAGL